MFIFFLHFHLVDIFFYYFPHDENADFTIFICSYHSTLSFETIHIASKRLDLEKEWKNVPGCPKNIELFYFFCSLDFLLNRLCAKYSDHLCYPKKKYILAKNKTLPIHMIYIISKNKGKRTLLPLGHRVSLLLFTIPLVRGLRCYFPKSFPYPLFYLSTFRHLFVFSFQRHLALH